MTDSAQFMDYLHLCPIKITGRSRRRFYTIRIDDSRVCYCRLNTIFLGLKRRQCLLGTAAVCSSPDRVTADGLSATCHDCTL